MTGVAIFAITGCSGSSEDEMSRDAQVYVATIRDVVARQPPPTDLEALPVVYVVAVGETPIAATVQAEVAGQLVEETDVRFADERAEAVLQDEEGAPVRDEGVMVAVGQLPRDVEPVDLEIEVYRSEEDWSKTILTLAERSSEWTVTSSSAVPSEGG